MKKDFKLLRIVEPYEDESLASFIVRLAKANYCPVSWLFSEMGYSKELNFSIYNFSNFLQDKQILKALSQMSGLSEKNITSLTVLKYNKSPWNLELKAKSPKDRDGYSGYINLRSKYCPLCLQETNYHRLHWHLEQVVVCLKHKTLLLNKCLKCGVMPTSLEISLGECRCGYVFSSTQPSLIDNFLLLRNQSRVYNLYRINIENEVFQEDLALGLDIRDNIFLIRFFVFVVHMLEKDDTDSECMVLVEQLLKDWPKTYLEVLQTIFESTYKKKPLGHLSTRILGLWTSRFKRWRYIEFEKTIIERISPVREISAQFHKKIFTTGLIKKKLKHILVDGEFINLYNLCLLFEFDAVTARSLFDVVYINGNSYVGFDVVIRFFIGFVENSGKVFDRGKYKQVKNIFLHFSQKYPNTTSIADIINIIRNKGIDYFVYPFDVGVNMIFALEEKVVEELLKLTNQN